MTQEELTMTVPTGQGNIEIYIPGSRDVIVKMSGGADSSILMLLLAKYRQEINPELKFKIVTTISTAKPYQYIFAKQVLEFINDIYPLGEYEHHTNDCVPLDGVPDGPDENGIDLNSDQWALDIQNLAQKLHKPDSVQYMGITANPSIEEMKLHKFDDGRDFERDTEVAVPTGEVLLEPNVFKFNRPFAQYDKKAVSDLFDTYNVTDTLFPLTRSCESFKFDETFSTHCGRCWWCRERNWAFGKLA